VKLTKKQREEVVILLRCVADDRIAAGYTSNTRLANAWQWIGVAALVADLAIESRLKAEDLVWSKVGRMPRYEDSCLEAAALVEEGVLP
jgi:hypothetical protein